MGGTSDAMNREQLDELRARAQRACDETRRILREFERNIEWSEELIARSEQFSAATLNEISESLKICKIAARYGNKCSLLWSSGQRANF